MDENIRYPEQHYNAENDNNSSGNKKIVIPVVHEHVTIKKEIVETGKVRVHKTVTEEDATVNIPVVQEAYNIARVPINKVYETLPPAIRYEGDTIIIPVLREVVVIQKHYEVIEEVRLTKQTTETPFMQEITLRKEHIKVDRIHNNEDKTEENF